MKFRLWSIFGAREVWWLLCLSSLSLSLFRWHCVVCAESRVGCGMCCVATGFLADWNEFSLARTQAYKCVCQAMVFWRVLFAGGCGVCVCVWGWLQASSERTRAPLFRAKISPGTEHRKAYSICKHPTIPKRPNRKKKTRTHEVCIEWRVNNKI